MSGIFQLMIFFLLTLSASASMAAGNNAQSLSQIEKTAERFIRNNIPSQKSVELVIKVDSLDPRLRLSRCQSPLEAFLPQNSRILARTTVGIRCNDSAKPWQLYVPVNIAKYTDIYVANIPLSQEDVVREEDLRRIKVDINRLRTRPMDNPKDIIGMVVKSSMAQGTPFSMLYLKQPIVVKRGAPVTIIASSAGLNIRMTGQALQPGARGEQISVKNSSSKRTIEATVVDASTVEVSL